jgi:hypothetical protein
VPLVTSLRNQDSQFEERTAAGVWRWTTRMDVSGASPTFQIRDIASPWGLLRDSVPIPGDIVLKMAESINELMNAYAPAIMIGPPSSLVFEVDEGWGFTPGQAVGVGNVGAYGSILNVSMATSAAYLTVSPPSVGGIALGETSSFDALVDSTNLKAADSPLAGTVMVQDPRATNTPQVVPFTVVIRPKAIIDLSAAVLEFHVTAPVPGDPYSPIPTQTFYVENTGLAASVLDYQIQKLTGLSQWLAAFSPPMGQVPGGGSQLVTVLAQPSTDMGIGTYEETLRVSGYSENLQMDVLVRLVIT